MTAVSFHVNLPDPTGYACRLLRKVYAGGGRAWVVGDPSQLRALDQALWTFSAHDFIPHCVVGAASAAVLSRSPIVLAPDTDGATHGDALVNLGDEVPQGYQRFARVAELVGLDEPSLARARDRWRRYAGDGHKPVRHEGKDGAS